MTEQAETAKELRQLLIESQQHNSKLTTIIKKQKAEYKEYKVRMEGIMIEYEQLKNINQQQYDQINIQMKKIEEMEAEYKIKQKQDGYGLEEEKYRKRILEEQCEELKRKCQRYEEICNVYEDKCSKQNEKYKKTEERHDKMQQKNQLSEESLHKLEENITQLAFKKEKFERECWNLEEKWNGLKGICSELEQKNTELQSMCEGSEDKYVELQKMFSNLEEKFKARSEKIQEIERRENTKTKEDNFMNSKYKSGLRIGSIDLTNNSGTGNGYTSENDRRSLLPSQQVNLLSEESNNNNISGINTTIQCNQPHPSTPLQKYIPSQQGEDFKQQRTDLTPTRAVSLLRKSSNPNNCSIPNNNNNNSANNVKQNSSFTKQNNIYNTPKCEEASQTNSNMKYCQSVPLIPKHYSIQTTLQSSESQRQSKTSLLRNHSPNPTPLLKQEMINDQKQPKQVDISKNSSSQEYTNLLFPRGRPNVNNLNDIHTNNGSYLDQSKGQYVSNNSYLNQTNQNILNYNSVQSGNHDTSSFIQEENLILPPKYQYLQGLKQQNSALSESKPTAIVSTSEQNPNQDRNLSPIPSSSPMPSQNNLSTYQDSQKNFAGYTSHQSQQHFTKNDSNLKYNSILNIQQLSPSNSNSLKFNLTHLKPPQDFLQAQQQNQKSDLFMYKTNPVVPSSSISSFPSLAYLASTDGRLPEQILSKISTKEQILQPQVQNLSYKSYNQEDYTGQTNGFPNQMQSIYCSSVIKDFEVAEHGISKIISQKLFHIYYLQSMKKFRSKKEVKSFMLQEEIILKEKPLQ